MRPTIVLACYDSGHYRSSFGLGPDTLIAAGLADHLRAHGHDVLVEDIGKVGDAQEREIATGFAVCAAVAAKVRAARDAGRFPIVLAGNCLTAAGAVAGEAAEFHRLVRPARRHQHARDVDLRLSRRHGAVVGAGTVLAADDGGYPWLPGDRPGALRAGRRQGSRPRRETAARSTADRSMCPATRRSSGQTR